MKREKRGFSLIELVISTAISLVLISMILRGMGFYQNTMAVQMRLERMSQVLDLTHEISHAVESSRRIVSVDFNHLDLETYDFGSYSVLDPQLYEHLKRVRYVYEENPSAIVREVYASTDSAKPEASMHFLKNVGLVPPMPLAPHFAASYLMANSTVGVRIELQITRPLSTEAWTPVKKEAYVRAY